MIYYNIKLIEDTGIQKMQPNKINKDHFIHKLEKNRYIEMLLEVEGKNESEKKKRHNNGSITQSRIKWT